MTTERIDVLAVMGALAELARDVAHLEADAHIELTDERLEELDARYGNVPRATKMAQALLRFTQAQADATEVRDAVAELIEADKEYDAAAEAYKALYAGTLHAEFVNVRDRMRDAALRRDAALARVQGGGA